VERCGLDASGSGQGPVAGLCDHGNDPLGSTKCGGISWRAEWLLASEERLCYMKLVSNLVKHPVSH
jgi:hypothetical protein